MSQLYVPDKVWLVCSDGMSKQQLKVTSQSTVKIAKGRLAGTIDDRTGGSFWCSKMVIAAAIIGAAVGAFIFVTGGAGALALGAVMAIGAAAGAGVGAILAAFPVCALTTLMYDWAPVHPRVTFEKKKALLELSKIDCLLGGEIRICYSAELADSIVNNNRVDTIKNVVIVIGCAFFGGNMAQGLFQGGTALWNAIKAKDYMTILSGGSVLGAGYAADKLYDDFKEIDWFSLGSINDFINQGNNESNDFEEVYDILSSPEGGLVDNLNSADDIFYQAQISTAQNITSINRTNTFVVSPNGVVVPPNTVTVNSLTLGNSVSFGGVNDISSNANTTSVSVTNINSVSLITNPNPSNTTSITATQGSNTTVRTNLPSELRSSIGTGLIENVLKDLADLGTNFLQSNFNEGDIAEALKNEEAKAKEGVTVIEHEI